jgi:fatty acid desaturase
MKGPARWLARAYRYPVDVIPTGIMGAVFAAQLSIFFFIDDPVRVAVAVTLLFPVQVNFAGMCHNHHHHRTFHSRLLNRAFEVMMFLQLGMLPYGYTLHHNIGHHEHYMDPERDTNRWRRRDGRAMGPWAFAWDLFVHMYPNVIRIGRTHPAVYRKFLRMFWVCLVVLALLLAIDPVNALLVFVAPLPPALLLQAQATYYQHAGLDSRDPFRASRNALDPLYNLRTCNLGYHTAHHLKPGLHWSQLPALHAEIAQQIPRELNL